MNISRKCNDLAASRRFLPALKFSRLKAIFKSLCFGRLSSSNAKETSLSSPPASNRFELLSSLPSESDVCDVSDIDSTEANETHYERSEGFPEQAEDDGIKDDAVVQDLELHFALWVRSAL